METPLPASSCIQVELGISRCLVCVNFSPISRCLFDHIIYVVITKPVDSGRKICWTFSMFKWTSSFLGRYTCLKKKCAGFCYFGLDSTHPLLIYLSLAAGNCWARTYPVIFWVHSSGLIRRVSRHSFLDDSDSPSLNTLLWQIEKQENHGKFRYARDP